MKKSKIIRFSICLLLLILVFSMNANAESGDFKDAQFFVENKTVSRDETFSVLVAMSDNPGIISLRLQVKYDSEVLELQNAAVQDLKSVSFGPTTRNPFTISWSDAIHGNMQEDAVIAKLTFRVKDAATIGKTFISIRYDADDVFNTAWENVNFTIKNAEINVVEYIPGDINSDKTVNMKDYALYQQYLDGWNTEIAILAADVNADTKQNMKDLALLQQYLNEWNVELKYGAVLNDSNYEKKVYGQSERGRDLEYYCFTPEEYSQTVLLNFAIHGFEDEYDGDGQVLVDTANDLISYYNENFDKLGDTRLVVIPCANPDGLYDGTTNNGFGRCNANGIDLNRDFDANYKSYSNVRNYTSYAFSAAESRALRDLVYLLTPNVVIDFHGWLNYTIGDYELADIFYEEMGLAHHVSFTSSNASGYFANWAHQQGAMGLLVEFTNSTTVPFDKLMSAVNRILNNDYNYSKKDNRFSKFDKISCYALSTERVTTYKFFDEPFSTTSYIDGTTDVVTILEVYENGWAKVEYPVSSGTKVAYTYLNDFISSEEMIQKFYEIALSQNTTVYRRSDLSTSYGTVYPTDKCYVVADDGNALQVIYELDAGGWKMGWLRK